MTVQELREALERLRPDWQLVPNQVGNFAILDDGEYIGYINLKPKEWDHSNCVHVFAAEDEKWISK